MRNLHGHSWKIAVLIGSTLVAAVACGTPAPSASVTEARQAFQTVTQDPKVNRHASAQLYEAQKANDRLERAIKAGEDEEDLDHLAYLTTRKTEIARSAAENGDLQQQMVQLGEKRDQLRLDARNQEIANLRKELASRETARGLVITLGDVLFQTGKATLAGGATRTLARAAELIQKYPERKVLVEGHTDDVGSDASNKLLSQQRAQAVADALIAEGVASGRLEVHGLGESSPAVPNTNAASRQQNRRVEIVLSSR